MKKNGEKIKVSVRFYTLAIVLNLSGSQLGPAWFMARRVVSHGQKTRGPLLAMSHTGWLIGIWDAYVMAYYHPFCKWVGFFIPNFYTKQPGVFLIAQVNTLEVIDH